MNSTRKTVVVSVVLAAMSPAATLGQQAPGTNGAGTPAGNARPAQQTPGGGQGAGASGAQQGATPSLGEAYEDSGGSLFATNPQAGGGGAVQTPSGRTVTPTSHTSLWTVRPKEPKRIAKFDLITVIVREESDSKSAATTDLKKEADFNAILQQYLKFSLGDAALKGRAPLDNQPQLNFQMERNFKGEGTSDRSDSMSARVQAQVIDVKENGILIVQATKQIKVDEEEQKFTLTGMVRAEDVTPDNTVLSTQLADLMLEKATKGATSDASKRGFIPRLLDKINPF